MRSNLCLQSWKTLCSYNANWEIIWFRTDLREFFRNELYAHINIPNESHPSPSISKVVLLSYSFSKGCRSINTTINVHVRSKDLHNVNNENNLLHETAKTQTVARDCFLQIGFWYNGITHSYNSIRQSLVAFSLWQIQLMIILEKA